MPTALHIQINDHHVDVPQSWNELPLRTQLMAYEILMTDNADVFDASDLVSGKKIMLACALLDVTPDFLEDWRKGCIEEQGNEEDGNLVYFAQLDQVLTCADFLFEKLPSEKEENGTRYQISLGLTKCPWPTLKRDREIGRKKSRGPMIYHAPADGLSNLTIYELAATFTTFEQYMKTQNESHANRLLAILYRPAKLITTENEQSNYQGDIRLPYLHHESTVDARQEWFAKQMQPPMRHLLLFWFASCREAIVKSYPSVFSGSPEGSDGRKYGWSGVLLSLADGLVHLETVAQSDHADALTYLSYLEDQRQRQKLKSI